MRKSTFNSSVRNAGSNQIFSPSSLRIHNSQVWEIAAYVTGDKAAQNGHRDRWMDGDSSRLSVIGPVTPWVQRAAESECEIGNGRCIFAFQPRSRTGFLLDDRWHASHPAHCRYHSTLHPPLFSLISPSCYHLVLILPASQNHPTLHQTSISSSNCFLFSPTSDRTAVSYVNAVNQIITWGEAAQV